ncbi:GPI biosynthesis protein family Pig-F-domain-containing protein [Irpex rosettiformis]|uniref:GPI biosynthesis protein family Pig-F-domain-containing protein n=1 Tax=Irpex rosettiformis TaxID=378272 RepID=A0ACB8U1W6_9APHY|nr:GPI biosynthesis protein family Pig-F-domain-containing protein [Irpex rosettiformis]
MAPAVQRSAVGTKATKRPTQTQSRPETSTNQPKAFFPYARYTSLVGVHTSLLAFTAIFLPMSAFADFSTPAQYKSRPKRAPIVVLTESPWRTVAWMCLGCLVLQWWWAGWVREWKLEASVSMEGNGQEQSSETEEHKAERILRQKEWDSQKPQVTIKAAVATLAASVAYHIVIVLFGAPIASHLGSTYLLALLLALLTVWTPAYVVGPPSLSSDSDSLVKRMTWICLFAELNPRSPIERSLVYPIVGAFLGCWTGVIPIGLDWERPWQAWPLTPAWGAIGGTILGSLWALVVNNFKEIVQLGITAERGSVKSKKSSKKPKQKKT